MNREAGWKSEGQLRSSRIKRVTVKGERARTSTTKEKDGGRNPGRGWTAAIVIIRSNIRTVLTVESWLGVETSVKRRTAVEVGPDQIRADITRSAALRLVPWMQRDRQRQQRRRRRRRRRRTRDSESVERASDKGEDGGEDETSRCVVRRREKGRAGNEPRAAARAGAACRGWSPGGPIRGGDGAEGGGARVPG
ncbi:hypothetical protein TESG_08414 [Trichophyton tonsurans CBS 112818]|uniref:Uncharacterized protein n=1 Tax=Trichophyton tonsurans (strain CBS 112818) TaxID=647933 RepID=F2RX19_TRIT1|nr:hypothetical protein TESG_08414 [Trichophyton tonsurans CBS 112818]